MKFFQQTGHIYTWNICSIEEDAAGDGLIFSPINLPFNKILSIPEEIRKESFFDPQLFLPDVAKGKLTTYNYHPTKIKENFEITDYNLVKNNVAENCVKVQENFGDKLIIPTKYYEYSKSNDYQEIEDYFVEPFFKCKTTHFHEVFLTFVINESYLSDVEQCSDLLDWMTSLDSITGFYLFFDVKRPSKQIKDESVLSEMMYIIYVLKQNNYKVIIGYSNTESFLLSLANPDIVASGSYENLRHFTISRFKKEEKRIQQSPLARVYSAPLLQWIEHTYVAALINSYPNWETLFGSNKYHPEMFSPTFEWHFQKPELYKHFFIEFNKQIKELPSNLADRETYIKQTINKALDIYAEIKNDGMLFDENSDVSHLYHWNNAILMFHKKVKER